MSYILNSLEPLASFLITGCALAQDCYKPNCSYVHYKAPAEEICTKDDVSVVCARYIFLVLTFYYVLVQCLHVAMA
jgi:hypothetical protein